MILNARGLSSGWMLAALVACFAAQLALALAVIPPWQNPDEPQHLMTARLILAHGPDFELGADRDEAGERAILASMTRHRWWAHYGQQTPDPLPATFADGPARVVKDYFGPPGGGSRLYYRGVAALFASAGFDDVVAQIYVMRLLAAIASMLTLVCAWCATRVWLDERAAVVITALIALHPQFIIVSTTASPDAAVNLAGALFWWGVVSVLVFRPLRQDGQSVRPKPDTTYRPDTTYWMRAALWAVAMCAAALMAFVIRRMGAPLLIVAAGVTLVFLGRLVFSGRSPRLAFTVAAGLAGALIVLTGALAWLAPHDVAMARQWSQFDVAQAIRSTIERADRLPAFLVSFFESFWLSAGWLRYRAPVSWYAVAAALTAVACAGLLLRRSAVEQHEGTPSRRSGRRGILLTAAVLIALQIAAVVAYYFGIVGVGPQGRYLFPAIPAILSLLWIGWRAWFPPERQTFAAVAIVSVAAVLNVTAWTAAILPAYLGDMAEIGIGT